MMIKKAEAQNLPELADLMHECYLKRYQGFRGLLEATFALIVQLIQDHYLQTEDDGLLYRIRSYLIPNDFESTSA